MAVEIATAYVSLVASGRGIASSIATELGQPLERAAKIAGQRVVDVIGREIAAGAKDAGSDAGASLTDALRRAMVRFDPPALDLDDVPAPVIGKPVIPAPDRLDLATTPAPKIGQPEIPAPDPIKVRDIAAPEIAQPEIPAPETGQLLSGAKKAGIAAGAAAGAGLTVGFVSNLGADLSNDRLAAQLGIKDPSYAKELGKIAGRLYAGAWGESLGEVNVALRSVLQNRLVDEDATNADLEAITAKVLDLATAFEQDLGGATKAAGQLIKTGMAKDGAEALDLIVRGFQQGVDRSEDFLDTITEYGTQFRKLGIDGPKALGLLSQGLRGGARDADIVADAIKEFSIRAVAGSELTAEGFAMIGLNAERMAAQIGAGGSSASSALDLVLDRVRAIPDPVERAQAAVALFGTQAEDLGDALFSLDPSTAVAGLGKIEGAAESMGATLNDNATTAFESLKRRAEVALGGVAGAFGPVLEVAPALGGLALTASAIGPHLGTAATGIANMAKSGAGFVGSIGPMPGILQSTGTNAATAGRALLGIAGTAAGLYAVTKGLQAIGGSANDVAVNLGRVAAASDDEVVASFSKLIRLTKDLSAADKAFDKILESSVSQAQRVEAALAAAGLETGRWKDKIDEAIASQRAVIGAKEKDAAITGQLAGSTAELGTSTGSLVEGLGKEEDAFTSLATKVETYDDAMSRLLGVHIDAERAAISYAESHHRLAASVQENGRTLDLATVGGRANREAILGIIDATTQHIGAMGREGATAAQLQATFATHRAELARVLGQLGLNKAEADRYLGLLDKVPATVLTRVDADTSPATKTILDWKAALARTSFKLPFGIGDPPRREHGGPVTAGQPYIVGERRPELFVPGSDGTIMPSVPSGRGPSGPLVGAMHVSVLHEEDTPLEISRSLGNLMFLVDA